MKQKIFCFTKSSSTQGSNKKFWQKRTAHDISLILHVIDNYDKGLLECSRGLYELLARET